MGLQRHLKVLGIFARLCHRDGKDRYLADMPRVLDCTLRTALRRYGELDRLARCWRTSSARRQAGGDGLTRSVGHLLRQAPRPCAR